MPLNIETSTSFPLAVPDLQVLYARVLQIRQTPDDVVSIAEISESKSQELNSTYRKKDYPTNVLTFSYDAENSVAVDEKLSPEHDVLICLEVARREAQEQRATLTDYCAWLVVHGLLHATGLDHEASEDSAKVTSQLEQEILTSAGFKYIPDSL